MGRIPPMHEMYPLELEPPLDEFDTKELSPLEVYLAHKAAAAADDYDERMRVKNGQHNRITGNFSRYQHDEALITLQEYAQEFGAGLDPDSQLALQAPTLTGFRHTLARLLHAVANALEGAA